LTARSPFGPCITRARGEEFTPAGGRIEVGATADENEVRFWVADTGPGIPPDHLPHLFDRFWQARRADSRGLGLGLTIVQGIVEAHRGRVWVASEMGKGTRFEFTLPRVRQDREGR
jgi:signal transduction histidine kinase